MGYIEETIEKIDKIDSKDSRFDVHHFLSVSKICGCKNCYCCAVRLWYNQRFYQQLRGNHVIED